MNWDAILFILFWAFLFGGMCLLDEWQKYKVHKRNAQRMIDEMPKYNKPRIQPDDINWNQWGR